MDSDKHCVDYILNSNKLSFTHWLRSCQLPAAPRFLLDSYFGVLQHGLSVKICGVGWAFGDGR